MKKIKYTLFLCESEDGKNKRIIIENEKGEFVKNPLSFIISVLPEHMQKAIQIGIANLVLNEKP